MAECGASITDSTIMCRAWFYAREFKRRWNRFVRVVGYSRRVDEAYMKVEDEWVYLYRAVDCGDKIVDFRLSARRDVAAARAFCCKALEHQGHAPRTATRPRIPRSMN
jgi:putative transposase